MDEKIFRLNMIKVFALGMKCVNDAIENRNSNLEALRERVKTLCAKYPLYN